MKTEAAGVDEELLSTRTSRKKNFDMAEITGGDGLWQRRIFIIIFFLHVPCASHVFSISFLAPNIDHWCARPPEARNLSVEQWRNLAMPSYDQHCSRYEYINFDRSNHSGHATIPCDAWEYDTALYGSTLLSQFNMVCDRKWLVSLSKSVFIAGMSCSLLVFAHISDRIGRKPVIIVSGITTILSAVISAFSTTFVTFLAARFFLAFGVTAFFTTPFVLLMEIVAPKYRNTYGMAVLLGWALGCVILPLIAWLIKDTVWIQLAITSPCLTILAIGWIPESPRWLLSHGKEKEAEEILLNAAKINGVKHSDEDIEALRALLRKGSESHKSGGSKGNVLDLLTTPGLRQITLNVYFNWFVVAFVYYGLTINTNELTGDPFTNFALSAFVEIPAIFLAIFVVESLGKKKLMTASMIISGIACVTCYLIPLDPWWLTNTVSLIGKFSISVSFCIIYVFSSELFPTVVRNIGLGSGSFCGRIASITAPFMRELGSATHPIFPQIIFGILALASGFLVMLLPETKNLSVVDTMEGAALSSRNIKCKFSTEVKADCFPVNLTEAEENNEQDDNNLFVSKITSSV